MAFSAMVRQIMMAIHGYTVNDDGTMEKTFSGSVSVFFCSFWKKSSLTPEQRQVWVLGIPFLGETANRQRAPRGFEQNSTDHMVTCDIDRYDVLIFLKACHLRVD